MHVVGRVGERHLGVGTTNADGADEQPYLNLQPGEDMLDAGAHFQLGGGGPGGAENLAAGHVWQSAMPSRCRHR